MERNKGVGIVLDPDMARLFRDIGRFGSLLSVRLKLIDRRHPVASPLFLSVYVCLVKRISIGILMFCRLRLIVFVLMICCL